MSHRARCSKKWFETVFDLLYLGTLSVAGCQLLGAASKWSLRWTFGLLTLLLCFGDAFHLIPRILDTWDRRIGYHHVSIGLGKMASSITMTLFYLGLWLIGAVHYGIAANWMTLFVLLLGMLRIIACLLPQNKWATIGTSQRWIIFRNVPLFLIGTAVMLLFAAGASQIADGLSQIWFAILLSFLCYAPVVLFSKKHPKVGVLMLPKSCAYVAIVLMGFSFPG